MALNYHHLGLAAAIDERVLCAESRRAGQGLPTTPSVEDVEASGSVPDTLVDFVKQRQQELRAAYYAAQQLRTREQILAHLHALKMPEIPKGSEPKPR